MEKKFERSSFNMQVVGFVPPNYLQIVLLLHATALTALQETELKFSYDSL